MKKIIAGLLIALVFLGCSSKEADNVNVEAKLVVGKSLVTLALKDQFDHPQIIKANTKKVIFAFSKDMAHICNDFFAKQTSDYLQKNNTLFVADVSAAPSIIRSFFIMPGLKEFKHIVLLLDDKKLAAPYRASQDTQKIVVVSISDKKITDIKTISSEDELKAVIQTK